MALMKGAIIFFVQIIGCMRLVTGADNNTVNATLGHSVTLPCVTKSMPQLHKQHMRVYWQHSLDHSSEPKVIQMYNNGDLDKKFQDPLFKDKAQVILEEIEKGNFSLTLYSVQESYQGIYQTVFMYKSRKTLDCTNQLYVGADFSKPNVSVNRCVKPMESVEVTCQTWGGLPMPSISWISNNSSVKLGRVETKGHQDPNNKTYAVLSRLFVNASSGQNFTCSVFNPTLGTTQESSVTVLACPITKPPFPFGVSALVAIIVVVIILVVVFVIICKKRNTSRSEVRAPATAETQMLQSGTTAENHTGFLDIKIV
ncbi:hypothetical protein GN956_G24067 [Arapaima gigas]